ncbi:MAG: hypothetical protein O3A46_07690 [Candidatus Poribacteria bacterium]|nr:hypothetical protein [Candidatus Poribacteria bacterium]
MRVTNPHTWTTILAMALCLAASSVVRAADATQSLVFGVYVGPIVKWLNDAEDGNATLTVAYDPTAPTMEASKEFRLALNVDARLTAETTPFTNIADATDILDTTWKIEDDANGDATKTGFETADTELGIGAFATTDNFLRNGATLKHASGDGNVKLTVSAKAERSERTQDGDIYEAHIILTAIPKVMGFSLEAWERLQRSVTER